MLDQHGLCKDPRIEVKITVTRCCKKKVQVPFVYCFVYWCRLEPSLAHRIPSKYYTLLSTLLCSLRKPRFHVSLPRPLSKFRLAVSKSCLRLCTSEVATAVTYFRASATDASPQTIKKGLGVFFAFASRHHPIFLGKSHAPAKQINNYVQTSELVCFISWCRKWVSWKPEMGFMETRFVDNVSWTYISSTLAFCGNSFHRLMFCRRHTFFYYRNILSHHRPSHFFGEY